MNVFISWSDERSRVVAEALRDWLPKVIQAIKPWISAKDIDKGTRWRGEIAEQLKISDTGIVCVTKDNQHAPWLLFEAGALSKSVDESFVWTYLLDLSSAEVEDPLAQFQSTVADKEDTRKLVKTINKALKDNILPEDVLKETFEKFWPDLEKKLEEATKVKSEREPPREDRDMLEEILNTVRALSREMTHIPKLPEGTVQLRGLDIPKYKRIRSPISEERRLRMDALLERKTGLTLPPDENED